MKRICVFCGSRTGDSPRFVEAARAFGTAAAKAQVGLVYGGARGGLMGAVADGALEAGGEVMGIIPRGLAAQEFAHPGLSKTLMVDTLAERKALMGAHADAFVALPGGFGTFDELFEVLTEAQVGLHTKPIGLLSVDQFFGPLVAFLRQVQQRGFIPPALSDVLLVKEHPEELVAGLWTHPVPESAVRWLGPT